MKHRTRLAVGVVTSMLVGATAHAQSNVELYGLVDNGIELHSSGYGSAWRLITGGSLGSRGGFRGSEDLGGGYKAIFKLETGILTDSGALGQGGRAFGRESSVGISSSYGVVKLGRIPTPYYSLQPFIDAFLLMGGSHIALTRSGTTSQQLLPMAANGRADNAAIYVSPVVSGFELQILRNAREGSTTNGPTTGASIRHTTGATDVVIGWTKQQGFGTDGSLSALVAGGSVDLGFARVYAGYDRERNACRLCTGSTMRISGLTTTGAGDFSILNLGVRVPYGAATLIAQWYRLRDRSDYAVNPGNRDVNWAGIGAEYRMSRRTLLYTTLAAIQNRNGSQYVLGTGGDQQPAGSVAPGNPRSTTFSAGIRHSF